VLYFQLGSTVNAVIPTTAITKMATDEPVSPASYRMESTSDGGRLRRHFLHRGSAAGAYQVTPLTESAVTATFSQ
jgi:hypothetical protein